MHQEGSWIPPTCLPGQGGFAKADAALEILAMVRDEEVLKKIRNFSDEIGEKL